MDEALRDEIDESAAATLGMPVAALRRPRVTVVPAEPDFDRVVLLRLGAYRALLTNAPSMASAARLGFEGHGQSIRALRSPPEAGHRPRT